MADTIQFELVSPERLLASMEASMVAVPGADGDFAVLPGHAPIVSTLRPGAIEVYTKGDTPSDRYFVTGGFVEMGVDTFTVLAEKSIPMDELDRATLEQEIQNCQEDVTDAGDDVEKAAAAQERLNQLQDILAAL